MDYVGTMSRSRAIGRLDRAVALSDRDLQRFSRGDEIIVGETVDKPLAKAVRHPSRPNSMDVFFDLE